MNSNKLIDQFLFNIGVSEKTFEQFKGSSISYFFDKEKKDISIEIYTNGKKSPFTNFELFNKINETFESKNLNVSSFLIKRKIINDILEIYENIIEFIKERKIKIDFSSFEIINNDNQFEMIVFNKETLNLIKEINEDLNLFLSSFSIISIPLKIKYDFNEIWTNKIEKAMNNILIEEEFVIPENKINEKIWKNYKIIDFSKLEMQNKIYFEGYVVGDQGFGSDIEIKNTKNGKKILIFSLGNGNQAVKINLFINDLESDLISKLESKSIYRIYGKYVLSDFDNEYILISNSISYLQKINESSLNNFIIDETKYKRNEFHVHTKMSIIDGVSNPKDYIKVAKAYNLNSITITDHNSVQAYPDAYSAGKNSGIIINYGAEFDVYDDIFTKIVINERSEILMDAEYVVFDLETTSISAFQNEIIEFGAVKYKNNKIIDRKQMFIKPNIKISEFTTNLTKINNEDLENAPKITEVIHEIKEWIGDSILVAHNASFDFNFLNKAYINNGLGKLSNPVIDTMKISWLLHPNSRNHRLGTLAKHEFVPYDLEVAHRADYDAQILAGILERLIYKLANDKNVRNLMDLNKQFDLIKDYYFSGHINIVSKNQNGLKNINKLISDANIKYFNVKKKQPRLPLSLFFDKSKMKNFLVGSSCSNGFLFQSIIDADWDKIDKLMKIYDYIEIFPLTSYSNLLVSGKLTEKQLINVLNKIIEFAEKYNVLVIASSNAHYSFPKEKIFRDVLINSPRVGNSFHPLLNFSNKNLTNPDAHLRSTTEMFEEFSKFLPKEKLKKFIIDNPNVLQSMIEEQTPIKDKLYTPILEGVDEKFEIKIQENLKKIYGEDVNPKIIERLNKEKNPIINHGYSIIYYLSSLAVEKSMNDGYLVGSRGSVGSSFVATMLGITEVNPLEPHYICDKCKNHEFVKGYDSGYDLPNKECPFCGSQMRGEGHNIPFETFLGFNADKVPDIDLNFSRENQSNIHQFMKKTLGESNVFKAGTISTAAYKTSVGFVKKYFEDTNKFTTKALVDWISANIEGVKRTTGQHPGGLIVIPKNMDVYDFTAIQYPGDDPNADWKTTHFDFHSIHDNILKLDFLGHLDPSSIKMLQNLTKVDPQSIPMNDSKVISLFSNNKALNYVQNLTGDDLGIIGIPEFGTNFVRDLVKSAKPKSFADLIRVSGLSHGTDVWAGNAQKLIESKKTTLSEVISVRDDIMTYLISFGIDNLMSFQIMESVRKGKGLTEEWENEMLSKGVSEWYINSCKLIKYMFPKAHATAYVMMAYRISWFKIYHPLEYYATFFSKRDVELDLEKINGGIENMKRHIKEIKSKSKWDRTKKDNDLLETYNIILEMYSRGITFATININKSESIEYIIDSENKKLIPPMSIVDGIGETVADKFVQVRNQSKYVSIEDFKNRSGVPKTTIDIIKKLNGFEGIPDSVDASNQLNLFE